VGKKNRDGETGLNREREGGRINSTTDKKRDGREKSERRSDRKGEQVLGSKGSQELSGKGK